jgi:hypothetical protein
MPALPGITFFGERDWAQLSSGVIRYRDLKAQDSPFLRALEFL